GQQEAGGEKAERTVHGTTGEAHGESLEQEPPDGKTTIKAETHKLRNSGSPHSRSSSDAAWRPGKEGFKQFVYFHVGGSVLFEFLNYSANKNRKSSSVRLCAKRSSPSTSSATAAFCFCSRRIFC